MTSIFNILLSTFRAKSKSKLLFSENPGTVNVNGKVESEGNYLPTLHIKHILMYIISSHTYFSSVE